MWDMFKFIILLILLSFSLTFLSHYVLLSSLSTIIDDILMLIILIMPFYSSYHIYKILKKWLKK